MRDPSDPAASNDPCVCHACKRVRMEMQARIDALSQRAEVDGAMVDELLAIAEGAEVRKAIGAAHNRAGPAGESR